MSQVVSRELSVNGTWSPAMWVFFRRRNAKREAVRLCRRLNSDDPVLGSVVCADETDRYIVRVFFGLRPASNLLFPPWRDCLIVAVDKESLAAERVVDDRRYDPVLR